MSKPFIYSALIFSLLVPGVLSADSVVEEIIARVNNDIITRSEYQHEQQQLKEDCLRQDSSRTE